MRFSVLVVVFALTTSMSVGACSTLDCNITADCCRDYLCQPDDLKVLTCTFQ
ncbi:hypothetical protein BDR06DRAFT_955404 [Suillus hirtellus]|nr:hypothetical protein BDR06DRAFT_955404 [Suillus hirtellus]